MELAQNLHQVQLTRLYLRDFMNWSGTERKGMQAQKGPWHAVKNLLRLRLPFCLAHQDILKMIDLNRGFPCTMCCASF